ncbi:SOS response-associated peptidase [Vibrio sp. EA2]|uniref:SOS response-associated peptidase n=1 Tax=Vibrio sp. EA2 TaxID=3079860 RepID=UPI00294A7A56|nr:SOS response-associated peptidase family protein [Vibrio sp. EA2]MDV6249849.1 SOS response-associated peptidase family protein [Vibrio sp. EA2]
MCGRLNVINEPLCGIVSEQLGISFKADTNKDLRPTQIVSTVGAVHGELQQLDLPWGIQPDWADSLIINAKAETVAVKATFANAFEFNRVIVPCSGWYEWIEENGQKIKYLFSLGENHVVYMAGIAVDNGRELVTLTTEPNKQCSEFHHRMPLLIPDKQVLDWISGEGKSVYQLLDNQFNATLTIKSSGS